MKCDICNEKIQYKVLLSALWGSFGYQKIRCRNCDKILKITFLSRLAISFGIVFPMILPLIFRYYVLTTLTKAVFFLLIYVVIFILLSPFIVKYKVIINVGNS